MNKNPEALMILCLNCGIINECMGHKREPPEYCPNCGRPFGPSVAAQEAYDELWEVKIPAAIKLLQSTDHTVTKPKEQRLAYFPLSDTKGQGHYTIMGDGK